MKWTILKSILSGQNYSSGCIKWQQQRKQRTFLVTLVRKPAQFSRLKSLAALTLPAECEYKTIKEWLINSALQTNTSDNCQAFCFSQERPATGRENKQFLRKLAWSRDFRNFLEQALRDRFVCGLANTNMQKCLLTEKDLTLEQAIVVATAIEIAMLEPQGNKKKAIAPGHTEEEEINCIGTLKCVGCCYCCQKKGHMISQCHFRTYKCHKCSNSYNQSVLETRPHR